MENNETLPYADLKKFGIMNAQNEFSSKLSSQDVDNFLKGSTLVADDDNNRLTFKLTDDKSKLEVNAYNKDIVNHKDLSSSELFEIASTDKSLYKPMADYGTIVSSGKTHFNNNPQNELTHYVEIQNERGKTTFYGNDLESKLKDFKVGDTVQISNVGIEKASITANIDDEVRAFNKYNNLFDVQLLTDENKETRSKLFEYDTKTKTVADIDTSTLEFDMINGIKLTPAQIRDLKRGKEISVDDDTKVQLSPKADNKAKVSSNTRILLLASLAVDGGLSFLIIKGVEKLQRMRLEYKKQQETASFRDGLETMKKLLETKIAQSPNDLSLKEKLKKVNGEISSHDQENPRTVATYKENGGLLIDKNEAHYLHDKTNEKSYYATILDSDNKEKTIWGIDLIEKLKDVPLFQHVDIKYAGKTDVNVKVPIRDDHRNVIGFEDKVVKRNSFDVIETEKKEISEKVLDHFKENNEKLNQIKSFLQSKSRLYPEDKSIINSINIVDKYISSTNVNKRDDNKNLQVVDYDTYEDANRAKEQKQKQEQDKDEERVHQKGRTR